jgi:hypothetical protein
LARQPWDLKLRPLAFGKFFVPKSKFLALARNMAHGLVFLVLEI